MPGGRSTSIIMSDASMPITASYASRVTTEWGKSNRPDKQAFTSAADSCQLKLSPTPVTSVHTCLKI